MDNHAGVLLRESKSPRMNTTILVRESVQRGHIVRHWWSSPVTLLGMAAFVAGALVPSSLLFMRVQDQEQRLHGDAVQLLRMERTKQALEAEVASAAHPVAHVAAPPQPPTATASATMLSVPPAPSFPSSLYPLPTLANPPSRIVPQAQSKPRPRVSDVGAPPVHAHDARAHKKLTTQRRHKDRVAAPSPRKPVAALSPTALPTHGIAAAQSRDAMPITAVVAAQVGIRQIEPGGVTLLTGQTVRVGGVFPNGERLLSVDTGKRLVVTNRRTLLLFAAH